MVGGRSGLVWAAGRGRLDCGARDGRTLAAAGNDRCVSVVHLGAKTFGESAVTMVRRQLTAAAGWVWCVLRCDPGRGGGHLAGLRASQSQRIGCRTAPMRRSGRSDSLGDRPGRRRGAGDGRSALVCLPLFSPTRCTLRALSCVCAAAASVGCLFALRSLLWLPRVVLWVHWRPVQVGGPADVGCGRQPAAQAGKCRLARARPVWRPPAAATVCAVCGRLAGVGRLFRATGTQDKLGALRRCRCGRTPAGWGCIPGRPADIGRSGAGGWRCDAR